jgi:outer membrane protein
MNFALLLLLAQTPPIMPKIEEPATPPNLELPTLEALRPLSAAEAVRVALLNQPSLRIASEAVNDAHGRLEQVRSGLYPSVSISGTYSRVSAFRGTVSGGSGGSTTGFNSAVTLRQLLFDFNHLRDQVEIAIANQKVAEHSYTRAENDLAFQVKQGFYDLVENISLVRVQEANVKSAGNQLALAKARLNAGIGQPADVVQAEANLNNAQQSLVQVRSGEIAAQISLAQLMGIDPRTPIQPTEGGEPTVAANDLSRLVDIALNQRPEILAAKDAFEGAHFQVKAAASADLPSFSLGLSATARGSNDPLVNESGGPSITVTFPIFDSGLQGGLLRSARATERSAMASQAAVRQQVIADVSQAYIALKSAEQRKTITQAQVENAKEGVRIAQGRYEAGLTTFVDVTTAQAALVTAQTNDANAEASINLARAALDHAVGEKAK